MNYFVECGCGVVVYLWEGFVGVVCQLICLWFDFEVVENEDYGLVQECQEQWCEVGVGVQILKDLGVSFICLLVLCECYYVGFEGFDIKIDEIEIFDI